MRRLLGPLPSDVLEVVAEMTGLDAAEIRGRSMLQRTARARVIAYWVAHKLGSSLWEVAGFFGRDQRTVVLTIRGVREDDPAAQEVLAECRRRFNTDRQLALALPSGHPDEGRRGD